MSSISESESPDRSGRDPAPLRAVLAATDLSDAADAALVSAATVGDAAGAEVHVMHCVKRPGPFGWWDETGEPARVADAEAMLREQLERACGAGWRPSSTVVTPGRPASEINARASVVGAALIAMGPGRRRFRRVRLDCPDGDVYRARSPEHPQASWSASRPRRSSSPSS
jgi:nucleotide-binding universal stress UspA family protein